MSVCQFQMESECPDQCPVSTCMVMMSPNDVWIVCPAFPMDS